MARHMADDSHTYRAVITERWEYLDGGGEPTEVTSIYGPYRSVGVCKGLITRKQDEAQRSNAITQRNLAKGWIREVHAKRRSVTGRVQKASTEWTDVED